MSYPHSRQLRRCLPLANPLLLALLLGAAPGCNGSLDHVYPDDDGGSGGLTGLVALAITPAQTTLEQEGTATTTQVFTVSGTFSSGAKRDVTAQVQLSLADPRLGSFSDGTLTTTPGVGGTTQVLATGAGVTATAALTVRVKLREVVSGAPTDAATTFSGGCTSALGSTPAIVYPESGTLVPPNLSEMTVMWSAAGNADLWELSVSSAGTDIRTYTTSREATLTGTAWSVLASSNVEGAVQLKVRGMVKGTPAACATSAAVTLKVAKESVRGGLYYWAAVSQGGVIRYDFGKPNQKAEAFFTSTHAGECVACHVLSHNSKRMAVTFTGGDGKAGVLDVATRKLAIDRTYAANFQVFTADDSKLIGSSKGSLDLRDALTGTLLGALSTGGKATMPELSPDGKTLVFVRPASHSSDWVFTGGSIVSAPFDGKALGTAKVLVQGSGSPNQNNYYPAFSPDGAAIIFNRSTGDSYSDDDAALYVVSAKGGTVVPLARANQAAGLRNSWARWSPFVQTYKQGKLFWFTFSSTRDYGHKLVNSTQASKSKNPQLWMAAFEAGGELKAGTDPSFPAFYLPFQDIKTNNHIAQWTKEVVPVE